MSKQKIYIAGPITGYDLSERDATFNKYQLFLEDNGFEVVNPMTLPHDHDKSWESYMRECITELVKCDKIFLIPDWHKSRGAKLEFEIADSLNMGMITYSGNL